MSFSGADRETHSRRCGPEPTRCRRLRSPRPHVEVRKRHCLFPPGGDRGGEIGKRPRARPCLAEARGLPVHRNGQGLRRSRIASPIDRRSFLRALGAGAGAALAARLAAAEPSKPKRPNILFLFTDDQRFDTIRALGNPHIRTPNLDRLVERGFVFRNPFCMGSMVGAVCLPSRTMVMTGRSLFRIPNGRSAKAPAGVPILPVALKTAGYTTFRTGKRGNTCVFACNAFDRNTSADDRGPESSKAHADRAIAFLRSQPKDAPFFLQVSFSHPHDPRVAPPEFMAMYDPEKIPLPKSFLPEHPFDNGEMKIRDEMLAPFPRTPEVMKRHLADYYATITYLDSQVGRIIDALTETGRADSTIIVFSSDQGLAVGGLHGLMGKQNLYEHNKVPLIFAGPGIPKGASDALVYLFDLFPTFCEIAGATIPPSVEGKSLMPVIRGEASKLRDTLFGAYRDVQRSARDARWKLIEYPKAGRTQLFDLASDPDELEDLSSDPRHAGDLARMRGDLKKLQAEFADPIRGKEK
ncbi:MAG: sulfatase-like hydrolase/transferase [Planctomycetes bacterium]|nr:sulfatase-like hydrolase/transferase [Planctomycetota bacterium]